MKLVKAVAKAFLWLALYLLCVSGVALAYLLTVEKYGDQGAIVFGASFLIVIVWIGLADAIYNKDS